MAVLQISAEKRLAACFTLDADGEGITSDVTSSGTTSTSYVDASSLTVNPSTAGDYLIFYGCTVNSSAASGNEQTVCARQGTTVVSDEPVFKPRSVDETFQFFHIQKVTISSSTTFYISHKVASGTGTGFVYGRTICAMRIDTFAEVVYTNFSSGVDHTTTDKIYPSVGSDDTDTEPNFCCSQSQAWATGLWLHIAWGTIAGTHSFGGNSQEMRFIIDTTAIEVLASAVNRHATLKDAWLQFVGYDLRIHDGSTIKYKVQFRNVIGTDTYRGPNDKGGICSIRLDGQSANMTIAGDTTLTGDVHLNP